MNSRRLIIIGSGPAAHTAGIYAARAELDPLLFEGFLAGGVAAGGQLTTTTDVENYPGFPSGVMGDELMQKMREQCLNSGCEIKTETIEAVDVSSKPFKVFTSTEARDEFKKLWTQDLVSLTESERWVKVGEKKIDGLYLAEAVIVASGATAKRLSIPGEEKLWNRGISACAVCDGAAPIFRNKPIVVVGGGDTACEEATFLTKYGSHVTMLVRKKELRASKVMQKRVLDNKKITIMFETEVVSAHGEKVLENLVVINNQTKKEQKIEASGLFYAIGHVPNVWFLEDQVKLDAEGYIITEPGTVKTSVDGVFAAGDVQDKKWRQAVTAAGSGCMAALSVEHYLASI